MPTAKYGLPMRGYRASAPRQAIGRDELSADSLDWRCDPIAGCVYRRLGSAIVGDTFGAQTGILEAKWSARARKVGEMQSPSLQDGYPTYSHLWGNDSGPWGQIGFFDTNGGVGVANRVLALGAYVQYPSRGLTTPNFFRATPICTENPLVPLGRYVLEKHRRVACAGARGWLDLGGYRYLPNSLGTPIRWNRQFIDGVAALTPERAFPWGQIPALWRPDVSTPTKSSDGGESWDGFDWFLLAVIFIREDGSYSMPFAVTWNGTTDAGFPPGNAVPGVSVNAAQGGTDAFTDRYHYLTYNNIPIGPDGTKWRLLVRTLKGRLQYTVGGAIVPGIPPPQAVPGSSTGWFPVALIQNNTQTTYNDYQGSDTVLQADSINIRSDQVWCPPARYVGSFDERVVVQHLLRPHPAAIVITQKQAYAVGNNGTVHNVPDSDVTGITRDVSVRDDQVANPRVAQKLVCSDGGIDPSTGIDLSLFTVRQVLGVINSSQSSEQTNVKGCWRAVPAPNADLDAAATNLRLTQVYMKLSTTLGSPTVQNNQLQTDGAAGSIANVAVGMLVSGAGIPANTYVGSVNANVSFALVDATGAAVNATATGTPNLKIGWDFGDTNAGEMRVFSNAYPGILYWSAAYLNAFRTRPRTSIFTGASPGHARNAANNFYLANERTVEETLGIGTGIGSLPDRAVMCYSKGIAVMRNILYGTSGQDADIRQVILNYQRGCISPNSIVSGNGWVGYLTPHGYVVTDGVREVIISGAVFDPDPGPGSLQGKWGYEIQQCIAAVAADTETYYFSAFVDHGRLYVTYRDSGSSARPNRMMVYDFTPSEGQSGLAQVLRPDGTPYPWSAPLTLVGTVMGAVQKSDGLRRYMANDANAGSTFDGRIDQFDSGFTDNGTVIAPSGYLVTDLLGTVHLKSPKKAYVVCRKQGVAGMKYGVSRDLARSTEDQMSLPNTSVRANGVPFQRIPVELPMIARGPKEVVEQVIRDDGTTAGTPDASDLPLFYGIELEYDELSTSQK